MNPNLFGATSNNPIDQLSHIAPKAKRVIYLFMSGAPSQLDMWDYKPGLGEWFDKELPDSVRNGQRITTMTSGQKRFPIAPSKFKFNQHGKAGTWVSELLPHTAKMVDDIAEDTKKDRLKIINATQESILTELNSKLIGTTQEVLIEGAKDSKPFGRNRNDKIVFVATNEPQENLQSGELVNVTIEETSPWYLKGTAVRLK